MARMLCPACRHRPEHVVMDDCPLCDGSGTLVLGPPTLTLYPPEVVSAAVVIIAESMLRRRSARLGRVPARYLTEVREYLETTGLLALGGVEGRARRHVAGGADREAATRLAVGSGADVRPWDVNVTADDVPLFEYEEDDRPLANGLPLLSAEGHPSHTARTVDPADALGSTRQTVRARRKRSRDARVLARAAVTQFEGRR